MNGMAEKQHGVSFRLQKNLRIGNRYTINDIAPILGINPVALKQTGVFKGRDSDAFIILVTLHKRSDTTQYMDILNEESACLFWEGQTNKRIAEDAFSNGLDCHVFIREFAGNPYVYYGRALVIRSHINNPGIPSQFFLDLPDFSAWQECMRTSTIEFKETTASSFCNTEKQRIQTIRTKQQNFRDGAIKLWNGKCAVTGVDDTSWLVASHIKPWRESNSMERIDPKNSLLLSPNYDKLFDRGVISFNPDNGRIILPETQTYQLWKNLERLGIDDEKHLEYVPDGTEKYLDYHRNRIFGYKPSPDFDVNTLLMEMLSVC